MIKKVKVKQKQVQLLWKMLAKEEKEELIWNMKIPHFIKIIKINQLMKNPLNQYFRIKKIKIGL